MLQEASGGHSGEVVHGVHGQEVKEVDVLTGRVASGIQASQEACMKILGASVENDAHQKKRACAVVALTHRVMMTVPWLPRSSCDSNIK